MKAWLICFAVSAWIADAVRWAQVIKSSGATAD
jgi:hypothetical protein